MAVKELQKNFYIMKNIFSCLLQKYVKELKDENFMLIQNRPYLVDFGRFLGCKGLILLFVSISQEWV